jgi:hypothetical protein
MKPDMKLLSRIFSGVRDPGGTVQEHHAPFDPAVCVSRMLNSRSRPDHGSPPAAVAGMGYRGKWISDLVRNICRKPPQCSQLELLSMLLELRQILQ